MRKLLRANFMRLKRDKVFLGGCIFLSLFCVLICMMQYWTMKQIDAQFFVDNFVFGSFQMIGVILSVFISLFVGTEYSDGTIRNKIIVGRSRTGIYLANTIGCSFGAVVITLLSMFFTMIVGIPLFGFFKSPLSYMLLMLIVYLVAVVAYASIYNLISMLIPNKAYAAVVNVLLAFVLLFLAVYLYQCLTAPEMIQQGTLMENGEIVFDMAPNPSYLTGTKREIYQFFLDFFPGGQAMQVASLEAAHPVWMIVYSVIITVVTNAAGVFFFRRKDIK